MRYVVTGRLKESCQLSPEEYFTLAVREWEVVLGWMAQGKALGYGRLGTPSGGTILLEAESETEVRMLIRSLPFAPYAELSIARVDPDAVGHGTTGLLLGARSAPAAPRPLDRW